MTCEVIHQIFLRSVSKGHITKKSVVYEYLGASVSGKQTIITKLAPGNPVSVFGSRICLLLTGVQQFAWVLLLSVVFTASSSREVVALNTGCVSGNCPDVPSDGISYTSGVSTVNVGDGVAGETVVNPGTIGIELYRYGSSGNSDISVTYEVIDYDTDGDSGTPDEQVLSANGTDPIMIEEEFIIVTAFDGEGNPVEFMIGSETYSGEAGGKALVELLSDSSVGIGGAVAGSLTVNNEAPFTTTNADGISVMSQGGQGGNGSCWTILFIYTHCSDGSNGGYAGSVAVNNNASITVNGTAEYQHGISATSLGGNGGKGGGFIGLFADAGAGGNGGAGGEVAVVLGTESAITTNGPKSHGVFAKSRGGDGGAAGWIGGAVVWGDAGGNGGDAAKVSVDNDGSILTTGWNSHGILAQSIGAGAGSGSSADGIYAEGGNGGGESSGAEVTVNNSGIITTENSDSFGIIAQSIGGGGGDGGGAGGLFTVGGRGGSGGGSDVVSVFDSGTVRTGAGLSTGDRSTAIFAQSIGGGGGNGGDAVSVSSTISVAIGGNGGLGGDGNEVHVTTEGSDIDTKGDEAHGIHAQSIGGGGGNGGLAVSGTLPGSSPINVSIALGGNGGGGGDAGETVNVETLGGTTIDTFGNGSYGIIAQSIGGGGGNGGTALSASGGPGLSVAVSIGGTGGVAGDGKNVDIVNAATITTIGDLSAGIFTQSIGGGGGNGGFAGSLAIGGGAASVSIGGSGGAGGEAGQIGIDNTGVIITTGNSAAGIFSQSIGGGGGNGGSALSGSIGLASVSTTIGGAGGAGNNGGLVDILNSGLIETQGNNSAGVFAQSIGGGGGSGGDATSLALAGPVAVAVAVGGSGGSGGTGGNVIVGNEGRIETAGVNSDGVFAQSIGGSGGSGGSATTGTLVFPIEIEGVEIPAISANVSVGGRGAGGGIAGTVDVSNYGEIVTSDSMSSGIFAQSVGGSGGRGGHATNISIAYNATFTGKVAVGGSGGQGGVGNTVTVDNYGIIHTQGDFSNGVFAQSVGGGGGTGGNATNISLSLTPPPTAPEDFIPTPSMDFDLAIGGDGGTGAVGGDVEVINYATIVTEGNFAAGVMAQSVGGAGGTGGDARTIQVELTADPMDFLPLTDLTSLDVTLVFGGTGGDGSHGRDVMVTNESDVATTGAFSHGIVAQSVGGGGGSGGSAMTFEFSNADIVPEIPVLDDISGLTTIEMTLQGSGGAGGDGGGVTLNSNGNVLTEGDFAMGVVAQSVAGGGGLAGFYNPHGITDNQIVNDIFNTFVDTDAGLSFAGSVGGGGTAGNIIVNHTGNIQTLGDAAHGLFAQSAAGQGVAGNVDITLDGLINAQGDNAYGIYAQSGGSSGNGDITLTITNGLVMGGTGPGAGVFISGGKDNTLFNHGTITSLPDLYGRAIVATGGNDQVENYGTVTGDVSLGAGTNSFNNRQDATFNSGETVSLGTGNFLNNDGTLSPGGSGKVFTTTLTGNLSQSDSGTFEVEVFRDGDHDKLFVSNGTAALNGTLSVIKKDILPYKDGTTYDIIEATGLEGVTGTFSTYDVYSSPLLRFSYRQQEDKGIVEVVAPSITTVATNRVERQIAEYLDRIMPDYTGELAYILGEFQSLSSSEFSDAFAGMSPAQYDNSTRTTYGVTQQYTQTLLKRIHSLRLTGETASTVPRIILTSGDEPTFIAYSGSDQSIGQLVRPGQQTEDVTYGLWFNAFGGWGDQDESDGFIGYDYTLQGLTIGLDRVFSDQYIFGISIGYSGTDIDLDGNLGYGDIKSLYGSVYGSYYAERGYIDTALSYGDQAYQNSRRIVIGAIERTASSDHNGDTYSAFAEGGYNIELNKWILQPFASLQYIYLDEESFREKGADSISQIIDERKTESLVSELGLRLAHVFQEGANSVIPEISAAWNYDFDIDDRVVTAAFVGSPNNSFSIRGQDVEKHGASVGAGVTLMNKGFSTLVRYNGEFRNDYQAHGIMGEMRIEF